MAREGGRSLLRLARVEEVSSDRVEEPWRAGWCAEGKKLVKVFAEIVLGQRDQWSVDEGDVHSRHGRGRELEQSYLSSTANGPNG